MNTEAKDRDAERDKLAEVSNKLEKLQAMLEDEQRKQNADRQERHNEQELVFIRFIVFVVTPPSHICKGIVKWISTHGSFNVLHAGYRYMLRKVEIFKVSRNSRAISRTTAPKLACLY